MRYQLDTPPALHVGGIVPPGSPVCFVWTSHLTSTCKAPAIHQVPSSRKWHESLDAWSRDRWSRDSRPFGMVLPAGAHEPRTSAKESSSDSQSFRRYDRHKFKFVFSRQSPPKLAVRNFSNNILELLELLELSVPNFLEHSRTLEKRSKEHSRTFEKATWYATSPSVPTSVPICTETFFFQFFYQNKFSQHQTSVLPGVIEDAESRGDIHCRIGRLDPCATDIRHTYAITHLNRL